MGIYTASIFKSGAPHNNSPITSMNDGVLRELSRRFCEYYQLADLVFLLLFVVNE